MPTLIGVLACEKAVEILVQESATAPDACNSCRRFMLMSSPPRISRHPTRPERHYKKRAARRAASERVRTGRNGCLAHRVGADAGFAARGRCGKARYWTPLRVGRLTAAASGARAIRP